ncbi:MAG: hypothetical protein HY974_03215 [Candidatus Kerfeldbacteria bacterium]|nr:hypothetical protein [Candidatus Kerfeldbacteria bacterium]
METKDSITNKKRAKILFALFIISLVGAAVWSYLAWVSLACLVGAAVTYVLAKKSEHDAAMSRSSGW